MSNALLRLSVLVTRWVVNTQLGSCLLFMQQHIMQVALLQAYVSMGLDNKYICIHVKASGLAGAGSVTDSGRVLEQQP